MRLRLFSLVVPLVLLSPTFAQDQAAQPPSVESLTRRAKVLLQAGQHHEAVKSFSDAIELSPADMSLYYSRATAYYALNRHPSALDDIETVLRMSDNSFHQAFLMKARILAKEGDWAGSRNVLKQYTAKTSKTDKDGSELLHDISQGETSTKATMKAQHAGNNELCIDEASKAIQIAPHAIFLRYTRADCALAMGDVESAVGDLTRLSHLRPTDTALLLRVANLSYFLSYSTTQAMGALKQCLHQDPDDKPCRTSHRLLKTLNKDFEKLEKVDRNGDWKGIIRLVIGYKDKVGMIKKFEDALQASIPSMALPSGIDPLKSSQPRRTLYKATCKAYGRDNQPTKGLQWCNTVLEFDENDADALTSRGDIAMSKEEWEEAVRAYETAFESSGRSSREIGQKLEKARRLLKQSKAKDYYKILGVPRDADDRAIKKAFRIKANTSHPDKGGSEAQMAAVNEAYEVLKNPELRARFDNGDDPNEPDSSRGHPFQQGGPFFHQGGFPGGGFPGGGFPGGGFPGGGFPGGGHFKFGH